MRTRTVARAAVLSAGLVAATLAAPAAALALPSTKIDDGEMPGPGLSIGMTLLYYVVIPVGAFLVLTGLSLLPSALKRPRYRPGRPWNHDPLWFRGPEDPERALTTAQPGVTARGGASAEW